jgi:hypothetical protein
MTGGATATRAGTEAAKMGLKLDGKLLSTVDVPNEALDLRPYEIRVPVSAERSRTAWMSRIAASPRLTMATRLNTG